jgi:hypothetical protein
LIVLPNSAHAQLADARENSFYSIEQFALHIALGRARSVPNQALRRGVTQSAEDPTLVRLTGADRIYAEHSEYLDRAFFWNAMDLTRKLAECQDYYSAHRVHGSLAGDTSAQRAGAPSPAPAALDHYDWRLHRRGLFQTPMAA